MEVGSCVTILLFSYPLLSLGGLVLPMVGSCGATLGPVTFLTWYFIGNKHRDVDDEGIFMTSMFFPLLLSYGAGSCVANFSTMGDVITFL